MPEYKKGDRVRVVRYPEEYRWQYPDNPDREYKNGDILVVGRDGHETIGIYHPISAASTSMECALIDIGRNEDQIHMCMPVEWLEPASDAAKRACTCDIMITGCICGVFRAEQCLRH